MVPFCSEMNFTGRFLIYVLERLPSNVNILLNEQLIKTNKINKNKKQTIYSARIKIASNMT